MRVLALLGLLVAGLVAAGVSRGATTTTHECDGLQICVPVAGPWVVVPTGAASGKPVEYQLNCPRGYIVGGLDAELTSNAIDLSFAGSLGSPVNPGITTSSYAVFTGVYVGTGAFPASFRPHIGCIPASGGGGRVPTSVTAIVGPGHPTIRRVQTVRVPIGTSRVTSACASGERLIAASHAVGFFSQLPPGKAAISAVRTTSETVRGSRAIVSVRVGSAAGGLRAVVQVGVVCAGGK